MNNYNDPLVKMLFECAATCSNCASACLGEEHVKMLARCISLDLDCADICTMTANYLARNSENVRKLIRTCADICNACADECGKHAEKHDHCRQCAEACRRCAEACLSFN